MSESEPLSNATLTADLAIPVTHAVFIDAFATYIRRFRLFASLVVLPIIAGTLSIGLAYGQIARLRAAIPPDFQSRLDALRNTHIGLKIALLNLGGYFGAWLCWAFAFAAVTAAVLREQQTDAEECFNVIRENPIEFLKTSSCLALSMLISFYVVSIASIAVVSAAAPRFDISLQMTSALYLVSQFVGVFLVAALNLPFVLAIPEAVIEKKGVVAALKISFVLTEGKSLLMLALFFETEITAYFLLAAIHSLIRSGLHGQGFQPLYGGEFYVGTIVCAFLQPIAMIGFAWIYATRTRELAQQQSEDAKYAVSDSSVADC